MIIYLLEMMNKMGIKISLQHFNINLTNSEKLMKVIDDRVSKKKISMTEFKKRIRHIYIEGRQTSAESYFDEVFQYIFAHFGITLNEEIMYPYRNAIIKDMIIEQQMIYDETIDYFFHEIEFGNDISMIHLLLVKMPALLRPIYNKQFEDVSKPCINGRQRLMEQLCYTILRAKADDESKNLKTK